MKLPFLAGMLIALAATSASAETLRIATSADFPPWEAVDSDGNMVGFDVDFGNEVCTRIDAECEWTNQAYDGLLPALIAKQYDMIVAAISITDERRQSITFSTAYAQAPAAFANIGDTYAEVSDAAALNEAVNAATVGVQGASTFEGLMAAHFKGSDVRVYQRADEIIADLRTGRLDAGLMEISAWEEFAEANKDIELTMFGPALTYDVYPELGAGIGIGLQPSADDLKARIDAAITSMLEDGTIAAMSQEWFGYDVSP
ncbi:MAG: transporter substrate-binding domain-containing protein [Geminicoccaceae bacterium]